ncbi:DUF6090 family protein [Portibacter marinus]|uniref:DUF6090 family protein n=1 Tax=Portibacter marinus TaxID=2898660 RepID=UPI001F2E22AF|nr:DUF6090 family protein [Portibacter marinus]
MIKFFRKIRRRLVAETKFSKYLLYAIGEIVLVVIGILIALQINNWNEKRKIRKNEIIILEQLNEDLSKNLEEVLEIKSILTKASGNSKSFLRFLNSQNNHVDSISVWLDKLDRNPIFNNANTTYKNLENNPNKIISNDTLRLRITLMYEKEFKNIDVRENGYKTHFYPEFKKHQRENFTMTTSVSEDGKEIIFDYNRPKNIEDLKKNDGFKNALIDMYNFLKLRINFLTMTENILWALIQDIEKEIASLK